jgi:hypothetical protein
LPLHPFLAPTDRSAGPGVARAPFEVHVELLHSFLRRRNEIVERIQALLNAQRKPTEYLQDGPALFRHFEDCFYIGVTHGESCLRGQLEDVHWRSGFMPRDIPGLHNGLVDPAEMMIRAFYLWRQTRWPGRNGRVHYAHTLLHLYVIRSLALLSMRCWDEGSRGAGDRLAQIQGALDGLWNTAPPDQPVLLRDARWLIPLAQSPATDELGCYFDVGAKVEDLPHVDRIEIHKAGVRMAAGHLRSQLRYHAIKRGVALDEARLVLNSRSSNALDFALLIHDLVPLFEAYENACRSNDRRTRLELADAICQGVSPDPELFLNRIELLGAYSMIEHLFVTTGGDGRVLHTPVGRRHVRLLHEYHARIARVVEPLHEDCSHFRPSPGAYSPYGVLYGFSSDLLEHMALRTLQPDAVAHFGLEDVFVGGPAAAEKLAWVTGWRKLPHLTPEVVKLFEYPQQFAEDIFDRIVQALNRRVSDNEANRRAPTGRLFIFPKDGLAIAADALLPADLPVRYIAASDEQIVSAQKADAVDEESLLSDRREGRCLVSYKTAGGWVALSKSLLTEILAEGRDVKIVDVPDAAAAALKLMCPDLIVLPGDARAGGPSLS